MKLIAFVIAVITTFSAFGESFIADSTKVYFRIGSRQFDPSLAGNREAMGTFVEKVKMAAVNNDVESVVIRACASPDGLDTFNKTLSRRRGETIEEYLLKHTGINRNLMKLEPAGVAWNELLQMVKANPDMPSQAKVLDILENVPVWIYDRNGKIIDGRKKRLMDLNRGVPYRWMMEHLFPELRNGVAVFLVRKTAAPEVEEKAPEMPATAEEPEVEQSAPVASDSAVSAPTSVETVPTYPAVDNQKDFVEHRVALKTNMLYYAALMPNIEVEWKFTDRWSAALEYQCAWYAKNAYPRRVYRMATVMPELRYWAIEHARWHGMYVGFFGGVGLYDLSNSKKGHKGEGFATGASAGYMWPISKHLSLDASLGVGYLRARDKVYKPVDGHFLYQLTKNINYVGPLRLKLSLVWRL